MNRALWSKCILEARWLLLGAVALAFGFNWLFVWISSTIKLSAMQEFLLQLPAAFEGFSGVPFSEMASYTGRIALAYVDPVVILIAVVWSISRGSDVVSGQLDRGTMELMAAQPIHRHTLLWTHLAVTLTGGVLIALACWLGTCAGLATVELGQEVPMWLYLPAALNLFTLIFFLAAITAMASAWGRYRKHTIGLIGSVYIISLILKLTGRMVPAVDWLVYGSFLTLYEPQRIVAAPDEAWQTLLFYGGPLLVMGAVALAAAHVIFTRRDLPAPV